MCESPEKEPKIHPLKPFPSVFLEVGTDKESFGVIELELFSDTPKTSENFRQLCTGEHGFGNQNKQLHYKGSHFHRIVPNLIIQAGDIINGDGSGGESIYGKYFGDESFKHKHNKGYLMAMANCGEKDTNSSQFYITLSDTPWLDDIHVVFGAVIKGFKVVDRIANLGKLDSTPTEKVIIRNCGETQHLYTKGQQKITDDAPDYNDTLHFYTSYFIPEAQSAWMALNMKNRRHLKVQLYIDGYKIMPRGKEKDTTVDDKFGGAVPVLIHGKETRKGATDCIEYIDRFLGSEEEFYPKVPIFIQITNYVFSFVNDMLKYHFYSMLLYQDELAQEKIKLMFLEDIKFISKMFKGPYMCGDEITINDIIMFPWFERMAVLEHYREFFVPNDDKEFYNWHQWASFIVVDRGQGMLRLGEPKKLIEYYSNYADGTVRNHHYQKYHEEYKPDWLMDESEYEKKKKEIEENKNSPLNIIS